MSGLTPVDDMNGFVWLLGWLVFSGILWTMTCRNQAMVAMGDWPRAANQFGRGCLLVNISLVLLLVLEQWMHVQIPFVSVFGWLLFGSLVLASIVIPGTLIWNLQTHDGVWQSAIHTAQDMLSTVKQASIQIRQLPWSDYCKALKTPWGIVGMIVLTLAVMEGRSAAMGPNRGLINFFDAFLSTLVLSGFVIVVAVTVWQLHLARLNAGNPRVDKQQTDLLSGDALTQTVQTLLGHRNDGVWCGRINGADLYASTEDRAVVIGPPGTGKTAFLIAQLMDWIQSGRSFVSLDIKPEIFGVLRFELENQGYRVITYNPTAQTGQRYNIMADLDSPEAIGELAGYLIPADHQGSNHTVFVESARDFLDAIISHLKASCPDPTLPDVYDFVTRFDQHGELLDALKHSIDQDARELANGLAITASNERLLGSIFATFRSNLRFLRYPAIRDSLSAGDFSLGELGGEQPVALFLQFEEKNKGITEKLLVAFVNHLFRYLISHTARGKVLILLDELGNAPRIDGLVEKLNTIRSRNLPTWMYFQSIEQMQLYGTMAGEGINKILGACDYQQVFRLNDNASAEMMSTAIGVVDREVFAESASYGHSLLFSTLDSQTQSRTLVTEPVIYPHELRKLANNESITIYQGAAWRGEATPYFKLYPEYAGMVPAAHESVGKQYAEIG